MAGALMQTNTILQGDALELAKTLPDNSIHCIVTSPPYWGLRDYGVSDQLGLEPTPEEYIAKMVALFRELRRALHPSGPLWLNMGTSYVSERMESDEMVLRDDLTPEEQAYVLRELANNVET